MVPLNICCYTAIIAIFIAGYKMPEIKYILARPLEELTLFTSRAFLLYFISYFLMAFALHRKRAAGTQFFSFIFPREIYAVKAFWLDAAYFCFITAFGYAVGSWLANLMSTEIYVAKGAGDYAVRAVGGVLVFDFLMFASHWVQHKTSLLWRFHSMHHAPEKLHFFVAFRHHPVDIVLMTFVMVLSYTLYPQPETNVFIIAFYLAGYHFRHSHIPLRYPRWLSLILVSPSDHQLHHDRAAGREAKNLGFIFSFWDRMAGTYAAA